jgi:putative nucleotidyltransferase with HDIG domain
MRASKRSLSSFVGNRPRKSAKDYLRSLTTGIAAWVIIAACLLLPFAASLDLGRWIATLVFSAVSVAAMTAHLSSRGLNTDDRTKFLRMIFLVAVLCLWGLQLAKYALGARLSDPGVALLGVSPIVAAGLLLGALSTPGTAVVALAFLTTCSIAAGISNPMDLSAAWLSGSVGAYAVNPLKRRSDLLRSGGLVTAAFALLGLCASLATAPIQVESLRAAVWSGIGGVCAMALFWLSVPVFERLFDLVSDWGLMELCSPEQELLHELTLHAPGTWAHSVMVGNLAEAAAKTIGANALLARACAYYHDVGKMRRPEFFIENQVGINVHDTITPNLSAKVIAAHVKDGLELATQYRLPQAIRDAIGQHHGTSLISYFYHQATVGMEQEDPILKQHFRYEGPLPQRKEIGILMLADVVEAATKSTEKMSPARLENLVANLVRERVEDGQLDACELTFRDVNKIVTSFVQTLTAVRHQRIEYSAAEETCEDKPSDADESVTLPPTIASGS